MCYEPAASGISFHGFQTALFCIGDVHTDENSPSRIAEELDEARNAYKKRVFVNGRLKGAVLMGDLSEMANLMEEIVPLSGS